jgi:hypothetical protein
MAFGTDWALVAGLGSSVHGSAITALFHVTETLHPTDDVTMNPC